MRIGIISMQRVPNYGSYLQALGLKIVLENLGHEVCFIDYNAMEPAVPYSRKERIKYMFFSSAFIRKINDKFKYYVLKKKSFPYEYRLFYLKELGIGYKKHNSYVDVAVIGSDEVFNCLQGGFNVGFSPMLFGEGIKASKVISYAASFGYTDDEGLNQYNKTEQVSRLLLNFDAISVRDAHSYEMILSLVGIKPEINLDPVLIADFPSIDFKVQYNDFVILYTYKSRYYSDKDKMLIKNFCKRNNKKLIAIGNSQDWVEISIHASPLELLEYFRAADFIITDTFHGSVFSIKYNKRFATLIRKDNEFKLSDLLQRLNQESRIITSFDELQMVYNKSPDFTETNIIIEREKKHTENYLRENFI